MDEVTVSAGEAGLRFHIDMPNLIHDDPITSLNHFS